MYKIITAMFVFSFLFVGSANAWYEKTGVDEFGNDILVYHPDGNGDPMKVGMPWGLTGEQTPVVKSGSKITDEAGTVDTCPAFFTQGCFNIVKTNYYHESRLNVAKDLVKNYGKATALRAFPSFAYWVNLVK